MNSQFPPLELPAPRHAARRRERPNPIWLDEARVAQRRQIADQLRAQLASIRKMTPEQLKAVMVKLKHEGSLPKGALSGTGLKIVAQPGENTTLAVVRSTGLDHLDQKLEEFGTGRTTLRRIRGKNRQIPPQQQLGYLKEIGLGDAKDRLAQTLLSQYSSLVQKQRLIYEVELTAPFETHPGPRKRETERAIDQLRGFLSINARGGIYDTDYNYGSARAVLWSTGAAFRELVEGNAWQTIITFFDARPKFETYSQTVRNFRIQDLGAINAPGPDAPLVCVIDSGVSAGNPFLRPVAHETSFRSYVPQEGEKVADGVGHGSGVASLVAYHSLNISRGAVNQARVRITSARILDDEGNLDKSPGPSGGRVQEEREARLLSNVLKRVVADFVPSGVRIFVLPYHFYDRLWNEEGKQLVARSSWVARTIDQLCLDNDIVFVLISGNIDKQEIGTLNSAKPFPTYLLDDRASIADPGQAALGVTVGSLAHSARVAAVGGTPIALEDQPSPFTRSGWGIRGAVKPDFVEYGGNAIIQNGIAWAQSNIGTDVVMASNKLTPPIQHNNGTSFSAPRVAYHLALIQQDLTSIVSQPTACLLKAFLGNSAIWPHEFGTGGDNARSVVDTLGGKEWLRVFGLGVPAWERALYCDDYSAVLYYDGQIEPDSVAYFSIPVTAELTGSSGQKRLTISLSYAPPVQRWGLEDYLGVRLKFRLFRGDVDPAEIEEAMSDPDLEGDEESPEVVRPNELAGKIGIKLRSRATLQHDIFEWTRHQDEHSQFGYTLAVVASKAKWGGDKPPPVKLAVVARLEDLSRSVAQVYSSVARVNAEAHVQARV